MGPGIFMNACTASAFMRNFFDMEQKVALVLLFPIVGSLFLAFFGRKIPRLAGWFATTMMLASLSSAFRPAVAAIRGMSTTLDAWSFIVTDTLSIEAAFRVDTLSGIMLFVVLGVGTLIHLYSVGYMKHDPGVSRFFAYLNAFIAFMLVLVLGDNLLMMFVGWEGVGLCSYLLIGFWYERDAPARAGMKAFITNRVGDLGFMTGIMLLAWLTGSARFVELNARAAELATLTISFGGISFNYIELAAFALFLGACGKSAQFPLHLWLPDAMEGPTPVSALIHAATMVTAGVYMVSRLAGVFTHAPVTREIMLVVAVITVLGSAVAACAQTDLKRILAYSTISQLGYMMAGAASGAYGAAVFHLATHAVFKALLFLAAGSVIHALGGMQDIREMGGLMKRIPATGTALIVGGLGLAGMPLFAGYYSKDLIITEAVHHGHPFVAVLLLVGALITAFYTARMIMLALFGNERFDEKTSHHLHESGMAMLIPLIALSIGTVTVGRVHLFERIQHEHGEHISWVLYSAWASVFVGLGYGVLRYARRQSHSTPWKEFIRSGFGYDALVEKVLIVPVLKLGEWSKNNVDRNGIDSVATGSAVGVGAIGEAMRSFQTGNIGTYLAYAVFGAAVLLWFVSL